MEEEALCVLAERFSFMRKINITFLLLLLFLFTGSFRHTMEDYKKFTRGEYNLCDSFQKKLR